MKQSALEKTSIAWFKLAECIERGEKERALKLYRLLMHSHNHEAYRKKLEADLLVFFDTKKSLIYYHEAIILYEQSGNKQEVIFIYEYLIKIFPQQLDFQKIVISSCNELGWLRKSYIYMTHLIFKMIAIDSLDSDIQFYLEKILDHSLISSNQKEIDRFLSMLSISNIRWYEKACQYLIIAT